MPAILKNKVRSILVVVYLIVLIVSSSALPAQEKSLGTKVVLVSIDGTPDYLLDQLIETGKVPNIARLVKGGVKAKGMITSFPAVTAVAHPMIWTGAYPWENGVSGGSCIPLPYKEHNILSYESGMRASRLLAEPIWSAVARQGKKAFVLQATQAYPQEGIYHGAEARFASNDENLTVLDGYAKKLQGYRLFDQDSVELREAGEWENLPQSDAGYRWFDSTSGEGKHFFLFFGSKDNPDSGFDTIWICSAKNGESKLAGLSPQAPGIKEDNFSEGILVKYQQFKAYVYFRLFKLAPDLSSFFMMRTAGHDILSFKQDIADKVFHQAGGFIGNGARTLYHRSMFGKKVTEGGNGDAELIYLETLKKMVELSSKAAAWALKNQDWDLFQAYTPIPDEVHHNWLGRLNPTGNLAKETVCEALRQPMDEIYKIVDDFVGVLMENMPDEALLVIVSDHGHAPVTKTLLPNVLLKKAGLLQFDAQGNIDLSKTKAMYYRGNTYFVVINSVKYKDGIVPLDQVEQVKSQVKAALDQAVDSQGNKLVTGYLEPEGTHESKEYYGGDIYLRLKEGVNCHPHYQGDEYLRKLAYPLSDHYGDPEFRYMNSIFVIGRKYGKVGQGYGKVRAVDVAPTICSILGVDSPKQASGKKLVDLIDLLRENR
jgi:predicted AlkP superfamily phosphohydrolase/phosphomutase